MADIELVIKIPERIYNDILSKNEHGIIFNAVKNGTPLSENHGDLIDVSRKITVSTYDEQYEEWGEKTMTVLEALNKWSDEGVRLADVIIPADMEVKNEIPVDNNVSGH